jgi:hypothetical protein
MRYIPSNRCLHICVAKSADIHMRVQRFHTYCPYLGDAQLEALGAAAEVLDLTTVLRVDDTGAGVVVREVTTLDEVGATALELGAGAAVTMTEEVGAVEPVAPPGLTTEVVREPLSM